MSNSQGVAAASDMVNRKHLYDVTQSVAAAGLASRPTATGQVDYSTFPVSENCIVQISQVCSL